MVRQYDNYGNRLWQTTSATAYTPSQNGGPNPCPAGSGPSSWAQYSTTNTNRVDASGLSFRYDAAGDVKSDGINSYLYDGEGRICAVQKSVSGLITNTQYLYDAEGRRVAKGSISSFSCDTTANGFTATAVYVLGPDGEQMTEMAANSSGGWQWAHTNVFAPGLSATYDADLTGQSEGAMYFHLSDWLGTRRQQTDYVGNPVLNFTGLPYGDGLATFPTSNTVVFDATEHHFTGKERDTESGNDYFEARYMASSMGRFLSPDPSNLSVDWWLPQTWNRYTYGLNNPLTMVDKNGLWPTYSHNNIIDESFPGMSKKDLQNLKDSQVTAAQEAEANWTAQGHSGFSPLALAAFGNALHTTEDRLSPAHVGEQPWANKPWWHYTTINHFFTEAWRSQSDVAATDNAARSLFRRTFGDEFDWVFFKNPCARTEASDKQGNSTGWSGCQ